MAFPTYINKGTFQSSTNATGPTPSLPASIQNGDLLIAVVSTPNDTTLASVNSDWTLLATIGDGTVATAGAVDVWVWYARYNGVALGAFSTTNARLKTQQVYAFRNAKTPTIFTATEQTTAATSWTLPSVTTTSADNFIFFAIGNDRDANNTANVNGYTNSNLANITELHDEVVNTGVGGGIATVYAEKATAGSTGTTSCTSAASNTASFITFAIEPTVAYTITADGATYSYSGGAANLLDNKLITADAGTYSYTGGAANLLDNKLVTADAGTFSYTGTDANVIVGRAVTADSGTYSYAGTDAGFLYNRALAADSGTYAYSGESATLSLSGVTSYTITAESGTFVYTGTEVGFLAGRSIAIDSGTYSYSGGDVTLTSARTLAADSGTYSYVGADASVLYNRKIVSDLGTYTYTGTNAGLLYNRSLTADSGTYSYSGTNANLVSARKVIASAGSFSYSGGTATLTFESGIIKIYLGSSKLTNLKLGNFTIYEAYLGTSQVWGTARPLNSINAEPRAFTYSGSAATMSRGRAMVANGATYTITGTANALKYSRRMIADAATYTLAGQAATLSNAYTWTRYATVLDDNGNGSSSIAAVFNTNGTISFNTSFGDLASLETDFTHWHDGGTVTGIGSSRWAKRTLISGDAVTGSLDTTLVALSSSKTISISTVGGEGKSGEVLVEIYSDSGGTTKVGQITLTISALI